MSVKARALDGVYGCSAAGIRARLDRLSDSGWASVAHGETDGNGEITDWAHQPFARGAHRIVFDSDYYFARLGLSAAYPEIAVAFRLRDESDTCEIRVVLAPSSYSMHLETRG